jgi:hypothetical protein
LQTGDQPDGGLYVITGVPGLHLYLAAQVQLLTNPSGIASVYDSLRYEYYMTTSNYQGLSSGNKVALLGDVFDAGKGF